MKMQPVASSTIAKIGHENGTLAVRFVNRTRKDGTNIPGALYEYDGVPASLYRTLLAADRNPKQSVGQAFDRFVKNAKPPYPYRRIDQ